MAHEILSIKLCELEDQFARLNSRIRLSETANPEQLQQEIKALQQECAEDELSLRKKLQLSRAEIASTISHTYTEIENAIHCSKEKLQGQAARQLDSDARIESQILLAEYALDFSAQAANRALLLALQAIHAQLIAEQNERSST